MWNHPLTNIEERHEVTQILFYPCRQTAAKRYFESFRLEHPHLKVIVVEDGLSSNGPHIRDLKRLNLRIVMGAKPGGHEFLFTQLHQAAAEGKTTDIEFLDPDNRQKAHFWENNGTPYQFYQ